MASRAFRSDASLAAELATRKRVEDLLGKHELTVVDRHWIERGSAITQVIEARLGAGPLMKIHVRLCWRRDGRNAREDLYSAAQLRARLIDDDWDKTLSAIAERELRDGNSHLLLVQDSAKGFVLAALLPCDQLPAIWSAQRAESARLQSLGLSGNLRKNHAANGSSPTIWLQDDRWPTTHTVADILWKWPGVVNILALPADSHEVASLDSIDDLPVDQTMPGRDLGERRVSVRSGYPRDAKVRAVVLARAAGQCEGSSCNEGRPFPGFLDVHHILGVGVSDRVWSCVALCPNCHRDAHYAPQRNAINAALRDYALQFAG